MFTVRLCCPVQNQRTQRDRMTHQLDIEGGYNIRDLGGYPTKDGRTTQPHRLIRSGNLDKMSARGQQQLIDYGVKTIIDVRDEWEAQHFPNPFVQSGRVAC